MKAKMSSHASPQAASARNDTYQTSLTRKHQSLKFGGFTWRCWTKHPGVFYLVVGVFWVFRYVQKSRETQSFSHNKHKVLAHLQEEILTADEAAVAAPSSFSFKLKTHRFINAHWFLHQSRRPPARKSSHRSNVYKGRQHAVKASGGYVSPICRRPAELMWVKTFTEREILYSPNNGKFIADSWGRFGDRITEKNCMQLNS